MNREDRIAALIEAFGGEGSPVDVMWAEHLLATGEAARLIPNIYDEVESRHD